MKEFMVTLVQSFLTLAIIAGFYIGLDIILG